MSILDRLRRRRPKIGYALGGGAVRGAAHLGALTVLEKAGIVPDCIAGTSAGAIVGGGYAAGVPIEEMSRLAHATTWRDVASVSLPVGLSVFDTSPLRGWIAEAIGDVTFPELRIPFSAVACNIADGSEVVLHEGSVVCAAQASSAIPGLFSPVRAGAMLLVDGGLVQNLPVSAVRQMGADIVIAIDVSPRLREENVPQNLADVVTSTLAIVAGNTQVTSRRDADFLIQPDIGRFRPWDFSAMAEIEQAGQRAAEEVIGSILERIG